MDEEREKTLQGFKTIKTFTLPQCEWSVENLLNKQ